MCHPPPPRRALIAVVLTGCTRRRKPSPFQLLRIPRQFTLSGSGSRWCSSEQHLWLRGKWPFLRPPTILRAQFPLLPPATEFFVAHVRSRVRGSRQKLNVQKSFQVIPPQFPRRWCWGIPLLREGPQLGWFIERPNSTYAMG